MTQYGTAAIDALTHLKAKGTTPAVAWDHAVQKSPEPMSLSSQKKSCPKGAFLGLCEAGLVKGVKPGKYTKSVENKSYAIKAVQLLKNWSTEPLPESKELWDILFPNNSKRHNSQMDVVIALWEADLIERDATIDETSGS